MGPTSAGLLAPVLGQGPCLEVLSARLYFDPMTGPSVKPGVTLGVWPQFRPVNAILDALLDDYFILC